VARCAHDCTHRHHHHHRGRRPAALRAPAGRGDHRRQRRRYLALCWLLDGWLGVPAAFLAGVGAFLVAFAAFVGRLAAQASPARGAVIAVIAANVMWALDSALMLVADWFSPTVAGQVVIALQAAGVAGLAALQYAGLRRA
jgi:hypothetical protein